jgi:hypothetical protein
MRYVTETEATGDCVQLVSCYHPVRQLQDVPITSATILHVLSTSHCMKRRSLTELLSTSNKFQMSHKYYIKFIYEAEVETLNWQKMLECIPLSCQVQFLLCLSS